MSVSCGIVGLPNVGKSTIFNALTAAQAEQGNYPFCTIEPNVAVVEVPDPKTSGASCGAHDRDPEGPADAPAGRPTSPVSSPALPRVRAWAISSSPTSASATPSCRSCVASRARRSSATSPVDPDRSDIEVIELELALADLATVEKAVERVVRKARTGDKDALAEQKTYLKAQELLQAGKLLRGEEWTAEERVHLRPLCLMSIKPMLYVANVADDDIDGSSEHARRVAERAKASGAEWLPICNDIECELRRLDDEERAVFMEDMGIEKMGLERLVRATYSLLGLQTFYTAGPKEIRAWTIHQGDKAPKAAGVIHTDFEKQFIRAEVYKVPDLVELKTEAAIKAAGKLRTEGRDYVMEPLDVCHFLVGR